MSTPEWLSNNVWPAWVDDEHYPADFRQHLSKIAFDLGHTYRLRSKDLMDSEIAKEAKRIEKKADSLLDQVRKFHSRTWIASEQTMKDMALNHLVEHGRFSDKDQEYISVGFDPYSLQYPLLGLIFHMQIVADQHGGKDGRKTKHIERWATDRIIRAATLAGIPLGRKGYQKTLELFDALFYNAGVDHPGTRMLSDARKDYRDNAKNQSKNFLVKSNKKK